MMHDRTVNDKQRLFLELVSAAQGCQLCENLRERTAVLSELNGNLHPKVFFIAEAPGRNGGDRTRTPLVGDASGANFQKLIDSIELKRTDVFITNSVLCNPRKPSGANRSPSKQEIFNCSGYLRRQIALLKPPVVVTLGSVALEAVKTVAYHTLSLREDAGRVFKWNGVLLVPLYHPSPQERTTNRLPSGCRSRQEK
jgi:uracil-DNA glycosylase